ncbi:MAG: ThuA domain-containing protein [Candidatus Limnocylindrales bacterium]
MTKLLLIAGRPSHSPGAHEYRAGMLLLAQCLQAVPNLEVDVHDEGWVSSDDAFAGASAVAIFADGGVRHPLLEDDHLATISNLIDERRLGFGLMHYAVELPEGDGAERVGSWIGGHYEDQVSCNPIWKARIEHLPAHPVARGVAPFETTDEWYFNIQFDQAAVDRSEMPGSAGRITPILVATPLNAVRQGPYVYPQGPYPHIVAASGRCETLMWVFERFDGGRGFGLTGGHFHANWANAAFRTAVLNALVWIAGVEVPVDGVRSVPTADDLSRNLDPIS